MGGGERARVYVGDDGRWYLEGSSHQEGVSGNVYCFRKDGFLANGPERVISPLFEFKNTFGACRAFRTETWWGDAATFIAGTAGHLRGGGESTGITQSSDARTASSLVTSGCDGKYRASWAYSFVVGTLGSGLLAKFFGGEFKVSGHGSVRSVDMAPLEAAMCYFTLLKGRFNGGGEWAEISPAVDANGVEVWRLKAHAGGESKVWANARCYLRDQR
jgi:hypothetical protein